jgi:hypothetical protein
MGLNLKYVCSFGKRDDDDDDDDDDGDDVNKILGNIRVNIKASASENVTFL